MSQFRKFIIAFFILFFWSRVGMTQKVDTVRIMEHLNHLTQTEHARNYQNMVILNEMATYIYDVFDGYADTTYYQEFALNNKGEKQFKNVICVFGSENDETLVVGAHYDVCGNQQGADDNASGVTGLLELARLLKGQPLKYRIELVAYTLEEPPFFRSSNMGSYVHAKSLIDNNVNVYGMVCLEMIGYFDDAKKSQDYPISMLSLIYGKKGDYITLVNKFGKGKFSRKFSRSFKHQKLIKTKKFTGPAALPGIDFSDHLNYWAFGISAVMITDTAFYRNKNYHQQTDVVETLDIKRMSQVIQNLFESIIVMK